VKKAIVAILLFIAIMSSSLVVLSGNSPVRTIYATYVPAPVGFSYTFNEPVGEIYGLRDATGNFYYYMADTSSTKTMVYVGNLTDIQAVVTGSFTAKLRLLKLFNEPGIIINTRSSKTGILESYLAYAGVYVYSSPYKIYYQSTPPTNNTDALAISNSLDFTGEWHHALVITNPNQYVSVTRKDGIPVTVSLADLLGVSSACVTFFINKPPYVPWTGGIVLSPVCTKNIQVLVKYVYNGNPYAVVFAANTRFGRIDYVIFAEPSADILDKAGIISLVESPNPIHITKLQQANGYFYYAYSQTDNVAPLDSVTAEDITQVANNQYICVIPRNTHILYALLWRYRPLNGTIKLGPGELVLFTEGGKTYWCHGDFSWLDTNEIPVVKASKYREIVQPIEIYTLDNTKFLVVISNGIVYDSSHVVIPFDVYQTNNIYIVAMGSVTPLYISQTTILASPFFLIAIMTVFAIVTIVVVNRKRKEKRILHIVFDVPPPPKSLSLTDMDSLNKISWKHIESFGVCPSTDDLIIYHQALPPLPDDVRVDEEVIVCPFRTNKRSEAILRELVELLQYGLWFANRIDKRGGYIFTRLADQLLYMYFYKHEDEAVPEEVIVHAFEHAYRSSNKIVAAYKRSLGLVIVVEPEIYDRLLRDLEELGEEGVINIATYISAKGLASRVPPERLAKFASEEIPRVIIITKDRYTELIEYLGERFTAISETYFKLKGGEI